MIRLVGGATEKTGQEVEGRNGKRRGVMEKKIGQEGRTKETVGQVR